MYYRISGAPFTIKNAEEKKEFIDIINADVNFSRHLVCRGVDAEQFTGKVNGVVVCEKDAPTKVYVFKCDGNFPTLKLYQRTSSVVYVIEFPLKKPESTVISEEKIQDIVEIIKTESEKIVESEPVFENPVEPEPVDEVVEEPVAQEVVKEQIEEPSTESEPEEEPVEKIDEQENVIQEHLEEDPQPKPKRRSRKKKS